MENKIYHLETLAIHAGQPIDKETGAVIPPLILATTFEREEDGSYRAGHQYSRKSNPNRNQLENCLAALEGGQAAACFASGVAAGAAILQALQSGDHVLAADDMYHGNSYLMREHFMRWGLQIDWIDMTDLPSVEKHIKNNTKIIWIESPSNPLMKLCDITALATLAHKHSCLLVCDNTFATPVLQRVFDLGADISLHATTKYLAGHSDVLGGAVISKKKDDFFAKIRDNQQAYGAVQAPFDCYLALRGIKTLAYRMKGHCENAMQVAQFLESHTAVEAVFYPGLASHKQHQLAKQQMRDFGGMLSFTVKAGESKAQQLVNKTRLFTQATSLGGVESLIEHRASVEGPLSKTPKNLIRVSVGLEHPADLIADLESALV